MEFLLRNTKDITVFPTAMNHYRWPCCQLEDILYPVNGPDVQGNLVTFVSNAP